MITFYSPVSAIVSILIAHVILTSLRIRLFCLTSFVINPFILKFADSSSRPPYTVPPVQRTQQTSHNRNKSISVKRLIVCTNRLWIRNINNSTSVQVDPIHEQNNNNEDDNTCNGKKYINDKQAKAPKCEKEIPRILHKMRLDTGLLPIDSHIDG